MAATYERKLSARYPTDLPSWEALKAHHRDEIRSASLRRLFSRDRKRFEGRSEVLRAPRPDHDRVGALEHPREREAGHRHAAVGRLRAQVVQ